MNQYRLIDDTGLFIEDCILDEIPVLEDGTHDPYYIDTPCPEGFYHPKWDGTQWIEGGIAPEPVITIEQLKQHLSDTDYRVIKCSECQLAGLPLPYDIEQLHAERQAIRDQIAELEQPNTQD